MIPTLEFLEPAAGSRVNTDSGRRANIPDTSALEVAVQTPANPGTGPDEPSGGEARPVRALNETPPASQQLMITIDQPGDGVVVLHVAGEVDLLTANTLGERIREHLVPANRVLVLDLTEVSFLGSAGLAEIVSTSQAGEDTGARILLVATKRAVLRPMEVTGLLSVFSVYDTVDAALANADG
jgi:anti-sigma B factor antagonist